MSSGPFRLLAIDDEPRVLDAYRALFRPENSWLEELAIHPGAQIPAGEEIRFELECQLSGRAGVESLRSALQQHNPFAVLFLDMRMPNGWSGLETAQEVRRLDQSVRIVLVSAYSDYSLEQIRAEIGSRFAFHSKPWSDQELVQLTRLLVSDWAYEQELRETQQELQQASAEAQRANRAKDQFLASISHELRTPLTAMLGYGELLQQELQQQQHKQLLKTMQVSGQTLLYLLNDMLDLSKIEAGKFEVDQVAFDLEEILREVEQIFALQAEHRGLQFTLEQAAAGAERSHLLLGDGKRIGQILINLVSNAIKFTPQGHVRLTVFSDPHRLHFVVEDSGIGISAAVLERLFQPFEQADRSISGRFGGTGLGLHISRLLARQMEGEITVESREGEGSRFEFTLPLRTGARKSAAESGEQCSTAVTAQLQGRVLVAEDTPELQQLVRRMIEPFGVEVEIAADGRQALQRATGHRYDLILMDMQMPLMDGIEATRRLREAGNQTPVVALTANVMQHQRVAFEAAGCNGFLSKPIHSARLLTLLRAHLQPRQRAAVAEVEVQVDDELRVLFLERMQQLAEELDATSAAGQQESLLRVLHTIKGSIGSFGYLTVSRTAEQAEEALERGEMARAAQRIDLLRQQIKDILAS